MLKYFVFNLCLVLLAWQVICEEPGDIDLEDLEDYDDIFDGQDLNDTENYIVPRPLRLQVSYNVKSYTLNWMSVNWHVAREICTSQNQVLASIKDYREHALILDLLARYGSYFLNDKSFWIGGSQLGHIGTWYWLSTGLPITYINWRSDSPTNYNRNCMLLLHDGRSSTANCDDNRPFICEDR